MNAFGLVVLLACNLALATSQSASCTGGYDKKKCFTRAELSSSTTGALSLMGSQPGPCFDYNEWGADLKDVCIVDKETNYMEPCNCGCTDGCGCKHSTNGGGCATSGSGTTTTTDPNPACDSSSVPSSPDCTSAKETYCAIGKDNTRCLYCGVDKDKCPNVCGRGLTQEEKDAILAKHNELRRKVAKGLETQSTNGQNQPIATNMNELLWDEDLAVMAQTWVDQCPTDHDKDSRTPEFKNSHAQNLGQTFASSFNTTSGNSKDTTIFVQGWYDEVRDFPRVPTSGMITHYTTVVTGVTTKVGCGWIKYYGPMPDGTKMYKQVFICNYGPTTISDFPYTAGTTPGSACTKGQNDGLCLQ